jgi:hypothetical protein
MPKVKAVLGHLSVETAQRKRNCSRHKSGKAAHPIVKDEACLVVKGSEGSKQNYCQESAEEILDLAENDLAALRKSLGI